MTSRSHVLQVDKEGNIKLQVQALGLPEDVTLSNPSVEAQVKTGDDPVTWDKATGVDIDQIAVTDRIDIRKLPTVVVLAPAQAVQFRWKKDPDPQPDPTDEPKPGDKYRVVVTANRSDGAIDWVGKPKVRVNP